MSKGGASGTTQSTGTTEPWADQQPYLNDIFSSAKDLYTGAAPAYYPLTTYSPMTKDSKDALAGASYVANQDLSDLGSITNTSLTSEKNILSGDNINHNLGYSTLTDLEKTNPGVNNAGSKFLTDRLNTNPAAESSGYSTLGDLSKTNQATQNAGWGTLGKLADTNQATQSTGYSLLDDLAGTNQATKSPSWGTLKNLSTSDEATNNIAGDTLTTNAGTNFGTKQYNEGTSDLSGVAKGDRLTKGNPYTKELSDSVLASVVPSIESQFISGGTLSSPETARAVTAGSVAGLAPSLFKNYADESKNQIEAASKISDNVLKGAEDTTTASKYYGDLTLGGIGYKTDAAKALTTDYLAGSDQQQSAADSMVKDYLTGSGQQQSAADSMVKDYLTGSGQQLSAADAQDKNYLTGSGQQLSAADALDKNYLTGSQQQLDAASNLGDQSIRGYSAQTTAAKDTSDAWNASVDQTLKGLELAPSIQQMPYTDLTQLYTTGDLQRKENQNVLDEDVARWNYGQTIPYDRLNQLIGAITGNYGGTTSLTQPYFDNSNSVGSTIGTAASAASLIDLI